MSINYLKNEECSCKKRHYCKVKNILLGSGTTKFIPKELEKLGISKAYILADKNTYNAAGKTVESILKKANIQFSEYIFNEDCLEPNEKAVGSAIVHYDTSCNGVLAVGAGVINDIGKIVANVTKKPYIIVATAPSMDGYVSETSSMVIDGLKVSLNSKCADVIIGDTDILKNAPLKMLKAGLGDMVAKYISICEWRISHVITNEYYCEKVAQLVREALKECIDNAEGLLKRDENAVESVFTGLVKCGVAMSYAGLSRPASGVEHYLSHIWDMRGLEFDMPVELHGIQCAYGTYLSARIYEMVKQIKPDSEKAMEFVSNFNFDNWSNELHSFLGKSSDAMIANEEKEGKYDIQKHKSRLDVIVKKWNEIINIINEEVPDVAFIEELFKKTRLPLTSEEIGIDKNLLPMSFKVSKDIRDKYVLSRLLWDLGVIDEISEKLMDVSF